MGEKKMTLEELVGWLNDNDVSYEIDYAGRLTAEGSLCGGFRDWVGTCKYTSLPGELVHVDGSLWLGQTSIVSLGGLTSVGEGLDLWNTPITSLGNLTSVGGFLALRDTSITSLGSLTFVEEDLYLQKTPIVSLGNLTSVGGCLHLQDTPLASLDNLTSVGESLYLRDTSITSLGDLASVGWSLVLQGASITSLNDLPQVGGDLHLDQHQLRLLTREVLQKVTGGIRYRDQATEKWIALSPDELGTIVAENERRERLHNTRGSDVDWDLYDR